MVLLKLQVAVFVLATVDALTCDWISGVGRLDPYITSGSIKTLSVNSEDECRAQCMQQTSFICASINYRTDDRTCQLLAENTQTATISSSDSQRRYSVRPDCAGIWHPWTATKGHYLNSGVQKNNQISTSDLRDCMTLCLQDEDNSYNCSSIVKSVSGGQCEIVNKRSDDTGVTPEVNTDYQYFNLPLWYSDNSDSTTNTKIINYGSAGKAFMLLFNYKIEADGYLVGWKYMIGHSTDYCDTYAAIWRRTGTGNSAVFNLITETLLTPEDASTGGIRFQFVQNSTEVVRKGDFLALYVEDLNKSGCRGNLVSFRPSASGDPSAYIRRSNPNRDRVDSLKPSNVTTETRGVALRAYIAEKLKLSGNPVPSHTNVSSGEIRITWEFPATTPNQELTTTHFKIEWSANSNFNTIKSSKLVSIEYRETVISNLNIQQPHYARVSTVRNYNGEELIQDVSTVSSLFCAERGKLTSGDVNIAESGILKPGEERTFTVSVPSLEADDCVSSVTSTYESGQLSNQIKTGPWTFTKQQGVTFELTVKVELLDGHENIIWQKEYTTSKAPNSPDRLTVDTRTSTSVTISWSPVDYTDKIYSIQQYQVTCITTNNTFNDSVTVNSVSYYNTPDSSTTSLTIESLYSQVEYSCAVKALLSENEFGESSREVMFWTKPAEPVLTYSNDGNTNIVSSGEEAITVPLPNITSSDDMLKGYDFMVIVVEKLSSRKKRSITIDSIDNVTVYITASFPVTNYPSSLSVGDNQTYDGYWNRPLDNQYSYHIAVGFKAKTEDNVLKFTTIPGAESVRLRGAPPTSTEGSVATTQKPGNMVGIIGGAVGGLTVLVVVVVVVAVVMKRRKNSGSEDPKPFSSSHPHRPVSEKPGKAPKPVGSAAPPSTGPESTTLIGENNSAEGSHDQHTDNTYENTAKLSPAASRPLLIPQLHSIISAEISTFQKDSFKEEFLLIKAPALPCKVGRLPENVKKNRFKNITAADETRVKLKVDEYNSDYVNANYIQDYHGRQRFIACQGPNDATLEDMWRLIHDSGTSTIVMLTNPVEATKKKCSVYWPDNNEVGVTFGKFKVTLIEEQMFAEYVVRKLKYTFNKVSRQVKQFHFTQWPDHGVPTTSGLLSFRHRVKQDMSASYKPAIIHCSAGVGRTGTFIGLDILIDEGKTTTAGGQDGTVDVMKCVYNMRLNRTQMVQTHEQYSFLYEIVAEALDCGDTSIVCSQFSETLQKMRQRPARGQRSVLEEQFRMVNAATASSKPRQLISPNAVSKENVEKNRDETVLPTERNSVSLPYISDSHNGYINAVYCDGYQNRRGFIVTQTPLTDTAEDFWHMTVDNKCPVIVYLNDCLNEKVYWPTNGGEKFQFGKLSIENTYSQEILNMETGSGVETELMCTHGHTSHEVTLLEVKIGDGRLLSTNQLTVLCNKLEKYTTAGHPPITIQCLNGSRLSGILVIAMNLYLRARMEQEVDVVLEVKLARRSRPQFIADSESFDLLYEFVSSYLSDFNDYSNFR